MWACFVLSTRKRGKPKHIKRRFSPGHDITVITSMFKKEEDDKLQLQPVILCSLPFQLRRTKSFKKHALSH